MARREIRRGRARSGHRRHRQCVRPQPARLARAAGRLAQRDAAAWRLARRRARGHLRARSGARLGRRPVARRGRGRGGRLGRRGRALRQHARQPLVHRHAERRRDRARREPRRQKAARRAGRGRLCRAAAQSRCEPERYVGYFEAHIEQGGTLEATGRRIGVVEAIIGNWNYWVTVTGEQNHAGTTEMHRRKDAAAALVRLAARIHDRFAEIAGTRARCGRSGAS